MGTDYGQSHEDYWDKEDRVGTSYRILPNGDWQWGDEGSPEPFEPLAGWERELLNREWVNQPKHYTSHPSGIECIEIVEHFNFNVGNVIKYVWRAGLKTDDPLTDLSKAKFYIEREIARIESETKEVQA